MKRLAAGENIPLSTPTVAVTVVSASPVDVSALLLTDHRRVRSDVDLVFFNNPSGPGVRYHPGAGTSADTVTVDVRAVPPDVATIAVTASLDGSGPATFAGAGMVTIGVTDDTGTPIAEFTPTGLTSQTALVCVEVYRRGDGWKVRAVGQGYDTGLAGIATDFGITVDDAPAPTDPSPAAPPPVAPPPVASPATARPPHQPNPGAIPMRSELFGPQHAEVGGPGISKQGGKMCRVGLAGEVFARSGAMVAYQGNLRFEALGAGGFGRMIRQAVTGEGVPLMKVSGNGDLFLANAAQDVHLIDLDGSDGLTINGANVLAFEPTLSYEVKRMHGAAAASNAGLFNCVFTGRGRIAITTDGVPVVLNVDQPTFADPQAAVAWSSSLRTTTKTNDQLNFGTLIGRSTGERFTLEFSGQGFVIVQPSELPPGGFIGGTGSGGQSGVGGTLGGLLGR